jgi:hypothetical protein
MVKFMTEVLQMADSNDSKDVDEREIIRDLQIVQVVANDIESQDELIKSVNDPELSAMYNENMLHSIGIYNKVSRELYVKLDKYFERCRKEEIPINTGYYRIYRILRNEIQTKDRKTI